MYKYIILLLSMYITHVVFTFDYGTETKDIMKHRVPAKNFAAGCKE